MGWGGIKKYNGLKSACGGWGFTASGANAVKPVLLSSKVSLDLGAS